MFDLRTNEQFRPYLLSGERILWTGRPKQGLVLRAADGLLIPFSLLWTGFVVFMLIQTMQVPGFPDFMLILFLALGLWAVIGRFVHDAAIRRKLTYAVTDQRVLVAKGPGKLSSFDIRRLPKLELSETRDGTGSISFDSGPSLFNQGRAAGLDIWVPSLVASYQFFRIDNPRKVYELIRDQAHA